MSSQKRGLPSTSSGQASVLKRPRTARTNQTWRRSGRNLVQRSWYMEQVVRRVVREELEHAEKSRSAQYCQSCTGNGLEDVVRSLENAAQKLMATVELANNHSPHLGRVDARSTGINDVRNLRLQFRTKLSGYLFTGRKLRGFGGARISVVLIDANTGDVVTSGLESSTKLDVVVLEGDFDKDDEDDWAHEEFKNFVVKERQQKGQLLKGDLQVTLNGGVGELGELKFTDNSSWNRSKTFRIGLKKGLGYCGNTRIREAKTNAFHVREHRGEASKKHDKPAFNDKIWRLKKIAKDGKCHQKLSEAGIHKVGDFLLQLFTDPMKLKEILGMSSNSTNWDTLEIHAKECEMNWKPYLYYTDGTRNHGAIFNTDHQLIGLIKDRVYCATDRLSADDLEHGNTIVKKAVDDWNDVWEFNGENFSPSMQKKSSGPTFSCEVFEGQIENLTPVESNLAPQTCAAPGGQEAPLANGIPTGGLPMQSHGNDFQYATRSHTIYSSSQVHHTVNVNAPPSEPSSAAISRSQPSSTLPQDPVMANFSDDMDDWLANILSQSPLYDGGSLSGASKGVIGWLKIKAVMRWGFFIRKIVMERRGIIVQPRIELQA